MTRFATFALVLTGLPLAACTDLAEMRAGAPITTATTPATLATEVGAERALARLPAEAGAVVSVTERREKDRLTQTVTLSGDAMARGGNRIRVVAANRDPAVTPRMTEERLEAELAAELPGIDMRPIGRMASASGAPLGLASGRSSDGTTCVYAWQESRAVPQGGRSGGFFASDEVDLSVRVRLCRQGMSEERLVALVEGLSLRGDVALRGGFGAPVATGVDALASAGYGRTAAVAATPVRPVAVEPVRVVKPRTASVATRPGSEPRPAPVEARPGVPTIADPIPLPSGG